MWYGRGSRTTGDFFPNPMERNTLDRLLRKPRRSFDKELIVYNVLPIAIRIRFLQCATGWSTPHERIGVQT